MKSYFSNLKYDLPAGLVVFLIAVPLCLGIALASGAPLYSGLIAGAVGGIVIGLISNSQLSVSGPAAGLTAIVLAAITSLGNFQVFLLAVVIAGVIQLLFGLVKAGTIASYFPSNVIKGMLTAIGIIIILKQLPHAFGYDRDSEGDFYFLQPDGDNTFSALLRPLYHIDLGATLITLFALSLLILWERPFMKKFKALPGPLVAVIAGVLLNILFARLFPKLALSPEHLVHIPVPKSVNEFTAQLNFPDFSALANPKVYLTAITIAIVASIETLLCIEAADKLDPQKRGTSTNRELVAQGVGNIVSGLVGGLPVTSVIVRTSANLNSGARSNMSTVFHGILIVLCAALIPGALNMIPLSVLAAILLMTGYKLTKLSIFREMFSKGLYQWLPFVITVAAVVFIDLLTGVAIGMAVAGFLILRVNMKASYFFHRETMEKGEQVVIRLSRDVSFLNRAAIRQTLQELPEGIHITIDARDTIYIDDDVLELIREFVSTTAPLRNIHASVIGLKAHYKRPARSFRVLRRSAMLRGFRKGQRFVTGQAAAVYKTISDSPLNLVRVLNREQQQAITPSRALGMLKEGNERFVNNLKLHRNLLQQVNETKENQFPFAVILSCIDSRTSAELIFDQGLGDIFSVRIAGNVVNEDILGSMEFACKVAGSKIVVVLGHTRCGAVKGAVEQVEMGNLTALLSKLKPAIDRSNLSKWNGADAYDKTDFVARKNVFVSVEQIKQRSPILNDLYERGQISIVGAMYDIETGRVEFYDKVAVSAV